MNSRKSKYTMSPERWAWLALKRRCGNSSDPAYAHYGGRGITVCKGISQTHLTIIAVLGYRPNGKIRVRSRYSLDRIDNDKGYWCDSCDECHLLKRSLNLRWATPSQQANNQRKNVLITYEGVTLTITEWAKRLGVSAGTLFSRHCRGMRGAEILAPIKQRKPCSAIVS